MAMAMASVVQWLSMVISLPLNGKSECKNAFLIEQLKRVCAIPPTDIFSDQMLLYYEMDLSHIAFATAVIVKDTCTNNQCNCVAAHCNRCNLFM